MVGQFWKTMAPIPSMKTWCSRYKKYGQGEAIGHGVYGELLKSLHDSRV